MNAEITLVLGKLEQTLKDQRSYLAAKPDHYLADLRHECEALRHDPRHLIRLSAGINQAVCEVIEAERLGNGGAR